VGGSINASRGGQQAKLDFDEEARALWARLNLDPSSRVTGQWNATDAIFRHAEGGGIVYVGNAVAAESLSMLTSLGITRVVNCTHGTSAIPNYHAGKLQYYTFPISHWSMNVNSSHESVIRFIAPMLAFIEEALQNGESVLVHCLAGAHRAGTTGCAILMHYAQMDPHTAIKTAKKCRPIIDPIGQLPEFLTRFHNARLVLRERDEVAASSSSSAKAPPV